jgi:protein ImuB
MCVYLPNWPLQRLGHQRAELRERPVVLVDSGAVRGPKVVLCSKSALRSGVRPAMPLAEALAIHPQLSIQEQDTEADRRALLKLARTAQRYSPIVGLEEGPSPAGLLLDLTGCAACFGGEDRLLQRAARDLTAEGWLVRLAIADTIGAAWGLCRYGSENSKSEARNPKQTQNSKSESRNKSITCSEFGILDFGFVSDFGFRISGFWAKPDEVNQVVSPLPVAALRLPDETLILLKRLGIRTVRNLLDLPRSELPARFGPLVLLRLDQALGRVPEVITAIDALPELHAAHALEYPIDRREDLFQVLDWLTDQIDQALRRRGLGARRLECRLVHEAAPPARIEVDLYRPSGCSQYLRSLLRTRLEHVRIPEPICTVHLRVALAEKLPDAQRDLFDSDSQEEESLAKLVDRLSNLLGSKAVTRARLVADAQPEYACRFDPVMQSSSLRLALARSTRGRPRVLRASAKRKQPLLETGEFGPRPLRLLPEPGKIDVLAIVPDGPPSRFRWGEIDFHVSHVVGPERIETGWWRGNDIRRDYYVVTTTAGNRFWLFRCRVSGSWFLHGCFE